MNKYFTLIILLISFNSILGQTIIKIRPNLIQNKNAKWIINGITLSDSHTQIKVYPNENKFDTIIFERDYENSHMSDTIFTKLPNKQKLTIIESSNNFLGFDIQKLKNTHIRTNCQNLKNTNEYGRIKFVILNKSLTDTIICSYSPLYYTGQMITKDKDYGWIYPCRNLYSSNIDIIYIFYKNKSLKYTPIINDNDFDLCLKGLDLIEWNADDSVNGLLLIKHIYVRLFNNEDIIIQYNYATGEFHLIVDK